MKQIQKSELPAIGTALAGGFYAGLFRNGDQLQALIVSPKAEGQIEDAEWGNYGNKIEGAMSCFDGFTNTKDMAAAGSGLAKRILALRIADLDDWYLPSRDELEICYRHLKPTTDRNYCSFRDGDNASSVPAGYPYSKESPARSRAVDLSQRRSSGVRTSTLRRMSAHIPGGRCTWPYLASQFINVHAVYINVNNFF